jgi:uncharacterized BrkB/YihY/UPF0761 family membrane protein
LSRLGSWPRAVIGGLVALVGLVWIGQGLGYLPGSFMSGDPTWAVIGAVVMLLGLAVAWSGVRRRTPPAD